MGHRVQVADGAPALYIGAMAYRVEHRIGVAAPPDVIWEVMADLPGWTSWNPLYARVEGRLLIDAKLTLEQRLEGQAPRTIQAQVVDWVPNSQIHWREAGLLRTTTRYLEIEKLTEEGCIFSNGVLVEGASVRFDPRRAKTRLRAGFMVMGEAMKARAEAAWAGRREPAPAIR